MAAWASRSFTNYLTPVVRDQYRDSRDDYRRESSAGWHVWLNREKEALKTKEIGMGTRRVVVVRHGMGHHNDLAGCSSAVSRDAWLNNTGMHQAVLLHHQLKEEPNALDWQNVGKVIVSPFRRTLQTCLNVMLGKNAQETKGLEGLIPFEVNPIISEHTYSVSTVGQGDRGSTRKELEDEALFKGYFDWSGIDEYCEDKNLPNEKWWYHNGGSFETTESFQQRAKDMRIWLAEQCFKLPEDKITFVFSHGGILSEAFETEKFKNCEIRVFDMHSDGSFSRVSSPISMVPHLAQVPSSSFIVDKVKYHHGAYIIKGTMNQQPFEVIKPIETIREIVLFEIKAALSDEDYNSLFYNSPFPGRGAISYYYEESYLQEWFKTFSNNFGILPQNTQTTILSFFKGEKIEENWKKRWGCISMEDQGLLVLDGVEISTDTVLVFGMALGREHFRFNSDFRDIHKVIRQALTDQQYEYIFSARFPQTLNQEHYSKWLNCVCQGLFSFPPSLTCDVLTFFAKKKVIFVDEEYVFAT